MMEPAPSIDKAFSLVIQGERQRSLGFNMSPSVESTALAVKNQGSNYNGNQSPNFPGHQNFNSNGKNFKGNTGKGRATCSHCGKLGHIMEKCYKLVCYPPGYKQKGRPSMANQVSIEGEQCQTEIAHSNNNNSFSNNCNSFPFTSEQCHQLLSLLDSQFPAHASTSGTKDGMHSVNSAINPNALSSNMFSCVQFQENICLNMQHSIFAVKPINRTAFGNETLVLDTGVKDHIIHSIICLPKSLILPLLLFNYLMVKKAIVSHIGTIQVASSLVLENVLCVPSFTFNLITVSRLTKTMSCCFVFLSTFCFIQDPKCWKTIGVGKLHNDLYLLQESTNFKSILDVSHILQSVFTSLVNSVAVSTTPIISKPYFRHLRLGHGLDNKFSALQSVFLM